jgi:hypothetical protein
MLSRAAIRALKRAAIQGGDGHAMLILLKRSIRFGHRRLALLRCLQAERMGLQLDAEDLRYCRQIADRMSREDLEGLLARLAA